MLLILMILGWAGLSFLYTKILISRNRVLKEKQMQLTLIGSIGSPIVYSGISVLIVILFQKTLDEIIAHEIGYWLYTFLAVIILITVPLICVLIGSRIVK